MILQENIQIGMVRTYFFNTTELSNCEMSVLAPKAPDNVQTKEWAEKKVISVPNEWLGFFKALLEAPTQHKSAKSLLESKFPNLLHIGARGCPLPLNCKSLASETCTLLDAEPSNVRELEEALPEAGSEEPVTGKKRGGKGKATIPIVDSVVRSVRIRANSNGFKMSTCKNKNCLGCSNAPRTLSPNSLKIWDCNVSA